MDDEKIYASKFNRSFALPLLGCALSAVCLGVIGASVGMNTAFTMAGFVLPWQPTFTPTNIPPTQTPAPRAAVTITSTPRPQRGRDNVEMLTIPAGTFWMGSNDAQSDEQPAHQVYVDAFSIDQFEITNAQYQKCVAAGKCKPPSRVSSSARSAYYGNPQFDNFPVIYVAWNDAVAYCGWVGERLPSEAEWEKAARGPALNLAEARIYPWGNTFDSARVNSKESNVGDTVAVGSFSSGASPYGVLDLAGNVWEWVADWYAPDYFNISPARNPPGPTSGDKRGARGGAWGSGQNYVRAALRNGLNPDARSFNVGIRCAQ